MTERNRDETMHAHLRAPSIMDPPAGFLERAVERGLSELALEEGRHAPLGLSDDDWDEDTFVRRAPSIVESDDGPPTLRFVRSPCG